MNDAQKKAYDLATEVTKQLLTLSSAILVFAATFLRDTGGGHTEIKWAIIFCYIALLLSIVCGVRTLYVLTILLSSIFSEDDEAVPILTSNPAIRKWTFYQHTLFISGVSLLAIFSIANL